MRFRVGIILVFFFTSLGFGRTDTQSFGDFSFEEVLSLVQKNSVKSIPQLLSLLPKQFRSSFTLVYNSTSIQNATLENPRAILFGRTGKFILTFNGDPSQGGFHRVEMLQFRDETKRFELRQITFENSKVEVSQADPEMCTGCHGNNPRPFWKSYNHWPGVFGTEDDKLYGQEETSYWTFRKLSKTNPRYKNLVFRTDLSSVWPYRQDDRHVVRPNNRLSRLLGGLASQSTSEIVLNSDFFKTYPNTVNFYFLRCDSSESEMLSQKIDGLFQSRFPLSRNVRAYQQLETIRNSHDQRFFELEKLILGKSMQRWDLSVAFQLEGARFSPDGSGQFNFANQIDDLVATRIFSQTASQDTELRNNFEPWSVEELFDKQNAPGLSKIFVTPYGVEQSYSEVNLFMNQDKARGSCSILEKRSAVELQLAM